MKIIMVTNEFPPSIGGVQTHVDELSRAMARLGHEVTVVTRRSIDSLPATERREGVRVLRIRLASSHLIYNWQLRKQLKALIRQGYEYIHIHGMRPLEACRGLGIPVIFTNHTSSFLRRITQGNKVLAKMRKQLEISDLVLAPSQELVDAAKATGFNGACQFIANGVDTSKFFPGTSDLRQKLGIPADAFVAVLARRLVEKNGVLYLAEAVAEIDNPDFHLIVAGDGAERAQFETIIKAGKSAPRVHLLGAVANTAMPDIFRAGNVSILPSLMEATSIAGLEAMACGLPLIGTKVGGIPAIIEDSVTGLLVEPRSPDALRKAILQLLSDHTSAHLLGEASHKKVIASFSWNKIAQLTLNAYKAAQKNHP